MFHNTIYHNIMNNDRQTYSDSDMQDYELKKYVFRKRKVSANRKKRSFPLVIKSCKMCGKYIYNDPRYDSYCKSCYDVNQNDEFVCIRLNYLLLCINVFLIYLILRLTKLSVKLLIDIV